MAEHASQRPRENDDCRISRSQLLRFIEAQFQAADRDHDVLLNIIELSNFLRYVSHPAFRSLRSRDRFR